jgi:hypothetical protein
MACVEPGGSAHILVSKVSWARFRVKFLRKLYGIAPNNFAESGFIRATDSPQKKPVFEAFLASGPKTR